MRLYNSLTRQVEDFVPLHAPDVSMYVCGPTVYDNPHLGNARPAVIFDVLFRVLRSQFGAVSYVRNYTDIDDKIMARAAEEGTSIGKLTERVIKAYQAQMDELGCLRPTFSPRATSHIRDMLALIARLIERGHAYQSEGHVLFSIASDPEHGALARHEPDKLRDGVRVEVASYKHDPADFVLWKPSEEDEPGWPSPYGYGRPGWHIECSAMIERNLGRTIDIHGGGGDLRFPHHECEISQSRCATGAPLARYWLHNGMLLVDGKKMAKSEGNFVTVVELLDKNYSGEAIRLALLGTHYRSPLDWTLARVKQADAVLRRWRSVLYPMRNQLADLIQEGRSPTTDWGSIVEPLLDDLNTPEFFSRVSARIDEMASHPDDALDLAWSAAKALQLVGVLPDVFTRQSLSPQEADLYRRRENARSFQNWKVSDRLRDQLLASGVIVSDTADASTWYRINACASA